jgi:predicted nucleic acid-binding Zn ribbon protein
MPTYIYETLPSDPESEPRRFEIVQRMNDPVLTEDPETGEPVKRLITGGVGIKLPGLKRSTVVNKKSAAATPCGCSTSVLKRLRHY